MLFGINCVTVQCLKKKYIMIQSDNEKLYILVGIPNESFRMFAF